jgi:hypothetical protein
MIKQYLPRRHGNHNPQHGGQFFMVPDNWHHLEGTYPTAGVCRIYLYDDYTKPLARDLVRAAIAHVVVLGRSFPLLASRNGRYLEAKLGAAPPPATMQAAVRFTSDGRQHVFDFRFDAYSKDPATTLTKIAPAPANIVRPTPPVPTSAPSPSPPPNAPPSAVIPVPGTLSTDGTASDVVTQFGTRTAQIRSLIDNGRFGEVYVPAFEAKDFAIALEAHESEVSPDRRKVFEAALGSIVRDAYLLDAFGDLGNRQQISIASERFAAAAETIRSMFPQP